MQKQIKTNLNINQFKDILRGLFPENKMEIWLLLISLFFYTCYSVVIALNSSVIDSKDILYDIYFSFDNPLIYQRGYIYIEGHPLILFITRPFIIIGNLLGELGGYKTKTVFITFLCTMLVSFCNIYVYRYLVKTIEIKRNIALLILLLFAFSGTNLILAFTPESFTISYFFLSYTLYFYSDCIKNNKKVTLLSSSFFSVILGGITITNFTKGIIPVLFFKETWASKLKKMATPCIILAVVILCYFIFLKENLIGLATDRIGFELILPTRGTHFETVFDWFFASTIFFPHIITFRGAEFGLYFDAIVFDVYHHWWQYLFSITLLCCMLYALIKNYKNVLVQIIFLYWLQDITIHAIIGYGIRDPFIFGGHWVFIVPLLLGWLYKSIRSDKHKKIYVSILVILSIELIINNSIELINFINLAMDKFPPYTL